MDNGMIAKMENVSRETFSIFLSSGWVYGLEAEVHLDCVKKLGWFL